MLRQTYICLICATMLASAMATRGAVNYEYDSLHRLTHVDYGNGTTIAYTYDAAGNRLTLVPTVPELPPIHWTGIGLN